MTDRSKMLIRKMLGRSAGVTALSILSMAAPAVAAEQLPHHS